MAQRRGERRAAPDERRVNHRLDTVMVTNPTRHHQSQLTTMPAQKERILERGAIAVLGALSHNMQVMKAVSPESPIQAVLRLQALKTYRSARRNQDA